VGFWLGGQTLWHKSQKQLPLNYKRQNVFLMNAKKHPKPDNLSHFPTDTKTANSKNEKIEIGIGFGIGFGVEVEMRDTMLQATRTNCNCNRSCAAAECREK